MTAREEILRAVRSARPPVEPLPALGDLGAPCSDLAARFAQSAVDVGGRCLRLPAADLPGHLAALAATLEARRIAALVPGVPGANVDLAAVRDPHQLADVDLCVVGGELGVAENGAVWITGHGGLSRAVLFLAQHLAVVVRTATLVPDLHAAYARIQIPRPGFGLFLSGPSKTADIEQALVIGAHGARSCTVLLVD